MAIQQQSWLLKNNTRNYPLADAAGHLDPSGLVDAHIAVPEANGQGQVFFSEVVITPAHASLVLSQDGVGVIGTLEVESPAPYYLYGLVCAPGAQATVMFGEAAQNSTKAVRATLDRVTGAVLETLVDRYPGAEASGVLFGSTVLDGQISLVGGAGVVVEPQDITYQLTGDVGTTRSIVIRLNQDAQTMTSMLSRCQLPTEAASTPEIITSINGVRPDNSGVVYLELLPHYFIATEEFATEHPESILLENGVKYDLTRPRLKLGYLDTNTIAVLDLDDYHDYCGAAGKRDYAIRYREKTCSSCVNASADVPPGGFDAADGVPFMFSGAYIRDNRLVTSWVAQALGTAQAGPSPLGITITLYDADGQVYVPLVNGAQNPVKVSAVVSVTGGGKRLGQDLVACATDPTAAPLPPGSQYGVPMVTATYALNQKIPKAQRYKIQIDYGLLKLAAPAALGATFDTYSMPYDGCVQYAQNPDYNPPTQDEVLPP